MRLIQHMTETHNGAHLKHRRFPMSCDSTLDLALQMWNVGKVVAETEGDNNILGPELSVNVFMLTAETNQIERRFSYIGPRRNSH
jgi:hypothetical protein